MHKLIGECKHIAQYDMREFKGRMFFVTDLHGHYDLLHQALHDVAFNSETDILFLGGDWTDRGPDSKHVLDYLCEPWIASVSGNHEQIFIDAYDSNWDEENRSVWTLIQNGGTWAFELSKQEQKMIRDVFIELPLGIEILLPNNIKIGIVHAQVPYDDWNQFTDITKAELEWDGQAVCQWARTHYNKDLAITVKGIDLVLVGHTPTVSSQPEQMGNMLFLDAGAHWRDRINFVEINDDFIKEYVK